MMTPLEFTEASLEPADPTGAGDVACDSGFRSAATASLVSLCTIARGAARRETLVSSAGGLRKADVVTHSIYAWVREAVVPRRGANRSAMRSGDASVAGSMSFSARLCEDMVVALPYSNSVGAANGTIDKVQESGR